MGRFCDVVIRRVVIEVKLVCAIALWWKHKIQKRVRQGPVSLLSTKTGNRTALLFPKVADSISFNRLITVSYASWLLAIALTFFVFQAYLQDLT